MTTTHIEIPGGTAGTVETLRCMAAIANAAAVTTRVRDLAASIVLGAPPRDGMAHARLLEQWIAAHTVYLADPTNAEAVNLVERSLDLIAANGIAQIDCDDVATLAAALALSIGVRARFVVGAFGEAGDLSAPYEHVWTELAPLDRDDWLTVDPPRYTVALPPLAHRLVMEL